MHTYILKKKIKKNKHNYNTGLFSKTKSLKFPHLISPTYNAAVKTMGINYVTNLNLNEQANEKLCTSGTLVSWRNYKFKH